MNNDSQDIRWQQRLHHFRKAFLLLEQSISIEVPSEVEWAGMIQFFEMSFELGWKVLKDYLEEEGFQINCPRVAIKQAFQAGLIEDGRIWLEALQDRNLTIHTYEETIALAVEKRIREFYYPALPNLLVDFTQKLQ